MDSKFLKSALFASAASLALCAATTPASADNIAAGTWYTGHFTTGLGTPLFGGIEYHVGTNTPGGAPSTTAPASPWVITLSTDNHSLTVADLEQAGDQFTLYDNGILLGSTSTPNPDSEYDYWNISQSLSDPNFSSGVFGLFAGTNVITGTYNGVVGNGDFAFEVSTPEPVTLSLFGAGLVGAAAMGMRRKKKAS